MIEISQAINQPHLSASSVGDYLDCGLLYRFSRIDKIQPESQPDSLIFGSAIHRTLAEFYEQKMIGIKLLLKDLHELWEGFWKELAEDDPNIQYSEGKDYQSLLREGKELLTAYYNKLPENDFKVLAVEEPFVLELDDLQVPVVGFIDLIEEDEAGSIIITDHKTSGRSYSIDEVDKNLQLTLYQLAVKSNGFGKREVLLRLDCLIKTKQPRFEQFWTSRSEMDEKRVIKKIQEVWRGVSKGVFIPNDGNWKCKGCRFKKHCEEWFREETK